MVVSALYGTARYDESKYDTIVKTFTIDANLLDTFTKSFTANAILVKEFTKSFTANALIRLICLKLILNHLQQILF